MSPPRRRADPQEHRSRVMRGLYVALGMLALALGVIGIFLPVLPTTPFVLLAAACFARGSQRFHRWLLEQRTFGPIVREWEQYRSIPYRTKLTAVVLMTLTFGASIVFFVQPGWLKLVLALIGVGLAVWLYRLPSRDRPR